MTIQDAKTRVIHLARRYAALSLPARALITVAASFLAGAGLGSLAEYAGYWYAVYHGVRPPLEGIPFLRVAVTLTTASMIITGILVFGVLIVALRWMLNVVVAQLSRFDWFVSFLSFLFGIKPPKIVTSQGLIEELRKLRVRRVTELALALGLSFVFLSVIFAFFDEEVNPPGSVVAGASLGLAVFVGVFLLWNQRLIIWLATVVALVALLVAPFLLFNPGVYGGLLRLLGYGGGLLITVEYGDDGYDRRIDRGALILRTNSSLILFDLEEGKIDECTDPVITEIPLAKVRSVHHQTGRLLDLPFRLPVNDWWSQNTAVERTGSSSRSP